MNKSLLQRSKETVLLRNRKYVLTKEHEDVAIAWMKDEVTTTQVARAMGKTGGNMSGNLLYLFAQALKNAYKNKRLTVK